MTDTTIAMGLVRYFLALALACVVALPSSAHAAPAPLGDDAAPKAGAEPVDLDLALTRARAAREADPSPATWLAEAELLEELGDYAGASQAYAERLDALPPDDEARGAARADVERVRDLSRGRVEDEPASTHRAELDKRWEVPSPRAQAPHLPDAPPPRRERIVTKWYFWVTVAAIAASAAAVTAIAIKATRDERRDSLDAFAPGSAGIRF